LACTAFDGSADALGLQSAFSRRSQMSQDALVTVIMPNRDHARCLPRALDALLAQTWTELEIIVVDDASGDNSLDVIAEYARRDARVRVLALKEHHGINRAVNAALASARGTFLHVAAADDFVTPAFVAHCVAQLNDNPRAGLCFSDPTEFYEAPARKILFPLYLSEQPVFYSPDALAALLRQSYFHISANTCVYRMAAFRDAGGYIAELHWLSDWFATLVVAMRCGVCYLPEQLTFSTVRPDSYSARNLRDGAAQRRLFDHALALVAAHADVAARMRSAALLPEYRLRTLIWLSRNPHGRRLMSSHLVARVIGRAAWSLLRPLVPAWGRRQLRRQQSRRAGSAFSETSF
jgi:hypothetical protein